MLLYQRDRLVGFALAHNAPLVEGRVREELRVLKLARRRRIASRGARAGGRGFRAARGDTARRAAHAGRVSWSVPAFDRAWGARSLDRSTNVTDRLRGETSRPRARPLQLGDLSPSHPPTRESHAFPPRSDSRRAAVPPRDRCLRAARSDRPGCRHAAGTDPGPRARTKIFST